MADQALMANPNAKQGLENMGLLFKLLRAYKALDKVFDLFYRDCDMLIIYNRYHSTSRSPADLIITQG